MLRGRVNTGLDERHGDEMLTVNTFQTASRSPRVLVTGTGGTSSIAVMMALNSERVDLFAADADPYAPGLHLVDEDRRLLIPRGDTTSRTELVYELCERHRIDVLIPSVDCELVLLASARTFFAGIGTKIVLASEETLRVCLDRWALQQRCEGAVRVPGALLADEDFDPFRPKLPVIVKSRLSGGSRGVQLVERREELKGIDRDGSLLVQEHLPGTEYSLGILARSDGRVIAVVPWPLQKVELGAATGRTVRDQRLEVIGRRVAEQIELTSVANIQLKETTGGEPALLEVNPCFSETMPLTIAGGMNMPKLCVDDALGLPLSEGIASSAWPTMIPNHRVDRIAGAVADG